jgi:hypothetical protein
MMILYSSEWTIYTITLCQHHTAHISNMASLICGVQNAAEFPLNSPITPPVVARQPRTIIAQREHNTKLLSLTIPQHLDGKRSINLNMVPSH